MNGKQQLRDVTFTEGDGDDGYLFANGTVVCPNPHCTDEILLPPVAVGFLIAKKSNLYRLFEGNPLTHDRNSEFNLRLKGCSSCGILAAPTQATIDQFLEKARLIVAGWR